MADKPFEVHTGVRLDESWWYHSQVCERCAKFDEKKPATAVEMCLEGAILFKRDNAKAQPKPETQRDEHYATKAQVKAAMRYRGD